MYKIQLIEDKTKWEAFVKSFPHTPFLQSWAWGEFNESLGSKVFRIGVLEGGKLKGCAQAVLMRRKLGTFLYVPHGPLLDWEDKRAVDLLLDEVKRYAFENRAHYVRVEPRDEYSNDLVKIFTAHRFRKAPTFVQAQVGWVLDIGEGKSLDQLLMEARKTTRYLIRQAQRQGVEVVQTDDPSRMKVFHELMSRTVERHRFTPQRRGYLQKQFEILSKEGIARLFVSYHEDKPLASAIIMFYGDTASYVHGASTPTKIPASYGLQWDAIREAKEDSFKIYDFWGVAPTDDPKHPWAGLTLFKKGFGGRRIDYIGAWDLPLSPRYLLVLLVEKIRKLTRGLW